MEIRRFMSQIGKQHGSYCVNKPKRRTDITENGCGIMAKSELRRLNREQLLQLLLETEEDNERLREENAQLRAQLQERFIRVEKCGSLAEAALALNGVFEAADAACRQYMENVQRRVDVAMLQNEEKCRRMQEESARKWGLGPSDTESAAASRQE